MLLPASGNVLPVHSSRSRGPLDLFTAETRLNNTFHFPLTSPLRRTFMATASMYQCMISGLIWLICMPNLSRHLRHVTRKSFALEMRYLRNNYMFVRRIIDSRLPETQLHTLSERIGGPEGRFDPSELRNSVLLWYVTRLSSVSYMQEKQEARNFISCCVLPPWHPHGSIERSKCRCEKAPVH